MDAYSEIRRRGWTQGSILDAPVGQALGLTDGVLTDGCEDFVLISHPCDIVARDFVREPYVEFLGRRVVAEKNGNLFFGKNPRAYQFESQGVVYELDMRARSTLPRGRLAEVSPNGMLGEADVRTLRHWLASRYARAALPDTFNDRIRSATKSVASALKRDGGPLSGIYLLVDGRELPPSESYEVAVYTTMLEDDFKDSTVRLACAQVTQAVGAALDDCDGVSVIDCSLKSESELSLSDIRELKRWDYDSLSFRDEDSATPPEGL